MKTFNEVFNAHPNLCKTGITLTRKPTMSSADYKAALAADRLALIGNQAHVLKVVDWIASNIEPINTISDKADSYQLKHLAEKEIGYTSNGEFIAAALMLEFKMKPIGVNANFAMSYKSIRAARDRIEKLSNHVDPFV